MTASVWYGGPVDGIIAVKCRRVNRTIYHQKQQILNLEFKKTQMVHGQGIYVGYLGFVGNKKNTGRKEFTNATKLGRLIKTWV